MNDLRDLLGEPGWHQDALEMKSVRIPFRSGLITERFHAACRATLAEASHRTGIPEHFFQRRVRRDDRHGAA